jgi:hypothetical protein
MPLRPPVFTVNPWPDLGEQTTRTSPDLLIYLPKLVYILPVKPFLIIIFNNVVLTMHIVSDLRGTSPGTTNVL